MFYKLIFSLMLILYLRYLFYYTKYTFTNHTLSRLPRIIICLISIPILTFMILSVQSTHTYPSNPFYKLLIPTYNSQIFKPNNSPKYPHQIFKANCTNSWLFLYPIFNYTCISYKYSFQPFIFSQPILSSSKILYLSTEPSTLVGFCRPLSPVLCAVYATTRYYHFLPTLITFSQNHTQSKVIDFVQYSHTLFPI